MITRVRRYLLPMALLASACSATMPTAPTVTDPPAAPAPVAFSELHTYHEPLEVYAGSSTQVHAGTFGHDADGALRGVDDVACTFDTDGGTLDVAPQGVDRAWHVAIVSVPHSLGDHFVQVHITCGGLTNVVRFYVAMDGALPTPEPPAAPAAPLCSVRPVTGCTPDPPAPPCLSTPQGCPTPVVPGPRS